MDRSHKQRLLIGFIGAPIILATGWLGGLWFLAIVSLIAAVSVYELLKMVHYPPRVLMVLALIVTPMCLISMYLQRTDLILMILVFTAIFTNISLLFYKKSEFLKMSFVGLGSIIYPGISLGTMIMLRNIDVSGQGGEGRYILIAVIIGVYATDIAAYYVGKLLGRHPLFLSVSPKKTIEGAVGGLVLCTLSMLVLWLVDFVPIFRLFDYFVIVITAGIFGQAGDLVESKMKREIGVKDSSGILLEHGGFLDRFDSLAVAAPLYWLYVYIKFFV